MWNKENQSTVIFFFVTVLLLAPLTVLLFSLDLSLETSYNMLHNQQTIFGHMFPSFWTRGKGGEDRRLREETVMSNCAIWFWHPGKCEYDWVITHVFSKHTYGPCISMLKNKSELFIIILTTSLLRLEVCNTKFERFKL